MSKQSIILYTENRLVTLLGECCQDENSVLGSDAIILAAGEGAVQDADHLDHEAHQFRVVGFCHHRLKQRFPLGRKAERRAGTDGPRLRLRLPLPASQLRLVVAGVVAVAVAPGRHRQRRRKWRERNRERRWFSAFVFRFARSPSFFPRFLYYSSDNATCIADLTATCLERQAQREAHII